MLELKNITKTYKPKRGVPVKALNGVSIRFPEKGMVFLLGKSGCGKSTLLNVIGGLDRYDSGELIIKGVSSKNFSQQRFDSYRNTYVGFIFQSYNILGEFTVGQNIALAIELQGRRAESAEINEILREVDLEGFGNRRPNELSGGQLQRVAIARALVKKPEIIMADEPTGALDSNTGKQVFDTLKKLSAKTLVIIVSHDREFAEGYADRIIELSDGHVIGDVELDNTASDMTEIEAYDTIAYNAAAYNEAAKDGESISYSGNSITVKSGYRLTEEDRIAINNYIASLNSDAVIGIEADKKRRIAQFESKCFIPTDETKIPKQDPSKFALIKSKLPLSKAFRIGASGLKFKKVRLVFTILLSVVAFVLFGLADTFGSYDHLSACTDSIVDSGITYLSFGKEVKTPSEYSAGDEYYYSSVGKMDENDLAEIKSRIGRDVKGVYENSVLTFSDLMNSEKYQKLSAASCIGTLSGIVEMNENDISEMGFKLKCGKLPDGSKNEIAITEYTAKCFMNYGIFDEESGEYITPSDYSFFEGYKLNIGDHYYTVTGVVDTNFNYDHYSRMFLERTEEDIDKMSTADMLVEFAMQSELCYEMENGFAECIIGGEGFIESFVKDNPKSIENYSANAYCTYSSDAGIYCEAYGDVRKLSEEATDNVIWLDGGESRKLNKDEIVISVSCFSFYNYSDSNPPESIDDFIDFFKKYTEVSVSFFNSNEGESESSAYVIAGIIEDNANVKSAIYISDSLCDKLLGTGDDYSPYSRAVGIMPESRLEVRKIVAASLEDGKDTVYPLQNAVTYELSIANEAFEILSKVFIWIGVGFAIFAALLMSNFIGTSVANKKREIGILRAIGSRSADVFRIFFSESFIIAMINFVISASATGIITAIINGTIRKTANLLLTVLHFGIRQIGLLLIISLGIALIASFLPVRHIAAKRPIDAINDK